MVSRYLYISLYIAQAAARPKRAFKLCFTIVMLPIIALIPTPALIIHDLLLLLARSRHNNALLLEHFRQRTVLVHGHENIAATNELLVNVELGYCGPL